MKMELSEISLPLNLTSVEVIDSESGFPVSFKVVLGVLYSIVFVGAVGGNSLVLYVIGTVPRMRTATNILLTNLAIGDLLISLLCLPFTFIIFIVSYWPFGEFLCYFVTPANTVGVMVSAFTLIVLAMERYISILHPLSPRMRKGHTPYVLGVVWAAAIAISSPLVVVSNVASHPVNETNGFDGEVMRPFCEEVSFSKKRVGLKRRILRSVM